MMLTPVLMMNYIDVVYFCFIVGGNLTTVSLRTHIHTHTQTQTQTQTQTEFTWNDCVRVRLQLRRQKSQSQQLLRGLGVAGCS